MARRSGNRLFSPARRRKTGCLMVIVLFVLAIVVTLSLNALSNRFVRLEIRPVTILNLPRQLERFRILHLSDLNAAKLGNNQANLLASLGKEPYSAVIMTGDMVGKGGNIQPLLELGAQIPANIPKIFITGDSDPHPYYTAPHGDDEVKAEYIRALESNDFIFLEAPYKLEQDGQIIWFCPGELFMLDLVSAEFSLTEQVNTLLASDNPYAPQTGAQLRYAQHRLDIIAQSKDAFAEMKPEDTIVAVMHHPPDTEQLGEMALLHQEEEVGVTPSLFLAGQFNNGQARLPGLGPIYLPKTSDRKGGFFPGDEDISGLSIVKGYPLHISPGLGVSGFYPVPVRLFNRPAATILELTSRMTR
ncbi:MAG: metallophosphoesterase [Clostridiales bacterium]|nr:metallophosphoesterase [Clostridiales bacterium]